MGLLTRYARNVFLQLLACATCSPEVMEASPRASGGIPVALDNNSSNNNNNGSSRIQGDPNLDSEAQEDSPEEVEQSKWSRAILISSILFEFLDLMNLALDIAFLVELFQLEDSISYACLLLIGLILGRLVLLRSDSLMVRGGIDWSPFWIEIHYSSPKVQRAFSLLYCLLFGETAVFLLEDYPSLVTYAHWPVINFPPAPLSTMDNYNIAMSAASMVILMILFLVALVASAFSVLPLWKEWSWHLKCFNCFKIILFLAFVALLGKYVMEMLIDAVTFAFSDVRKVPSNKIAGISVCEPETLETRYEFCDERVFFIRVAIAWGIAALFTGYLFWKPAKGLCEKRNTSTNEKAKQTANSASAVTNTSTNDQVKQTANSASAVTNTSTSEQVKWTASGASVETNASKNVEVRWTPKGASVETNTSRNGQVRRTPNGAGVETNVSRTASVETNASRNEQARRAPNGASVETNVSRNEHVKRTPNGASVATNASRNGQLRPTPSNGASVATNASRNEQLRPTPNGANASRNAQLRPAPNGASVATNASRNGQVGRTPNGASVETNISRNE